MLLGLCKQLGSQFFLHLRIEHFVQSVGQSLGPLGIPLLGQGTVLVPEEQLSYFFKVSLVGTGGPVGSNGEEVSVIPWSEFISSTFLASCMHYIYI